MYINVNKKNKGNSSIPLFETQNRLIKKNKSGLQTKTEGNDEMHPMHPIINYPFFDGDVPLSPFYGINIS